MNKRRALNYVMIAYLVLGAAGVVRFVWTPDGPAALVDAIASLLCVGLLMGVHRNLERMPDR